METHPNAASMLRSRSLPYSSSRLSKPLLALSTRMLSPSSPSSSATASSETRKGYPSLNPKPSFSNLSLFPQNPHHTLQTMTISNCFSHSGPTNPIPISELHEADSVDSLVVVSFYKFADFHDHALLRQPLKQLCQQLVFHSFLYPHFINYYYSFCVPKQTFNFLPKIMIRTINFVISAHMIITTIIK